MSTKTLSPADLSTEELEALLAKRKDSERQQKEDRRKEYEKLRDGVCNGLGLEAETLHGIICTLKLAAMQELTDFRSKMLEYGELRNGESNKGSFSIHNEYYKIEFASQVNKRFDERAELAEAKMRLFMDSFLRKKDAKTAKLVRSLMERNEKTHDYDIDQINRLYKMEEDFDDPNWKEAIALFKESYSPAATAQYIRFYRRGGNNSWVPLPLDFAKAPGEIPAGEIEE